MKKLTRIQLAFSIPLVASLLACGGGGGGGGGTNTTPPKTIADRLDYSAPSSGAYTLVKDPSSSQGHLVLNLMGPVGVSGTGVGFILSADSTKVTWAKPASSDSILAHTGLFDLGTTPPQLAVAKVTGDQLQVAFYQKGTTKPPVTFTSSSILATVALDLKSNIPVGTVVNLSAISGKATLTQGASAPLAITLTPGTITAN